MRHIILTLCTLVLSVAASLVHASITPIWSTGVAVPGEQVILYLIDSESGQDVFTLSQQPKVKSATVRVLDPRAGTNPLDPNRGTVEVIPILIKPDAAGMLQVENITAEYRSGKKETVSVPPLPVRPTSDIRWYSDPVPYGALWYTDIRDGYVDQPVRVSLKLFLRGDCNAPYPPQLHAVGVRVGTFDRPVQGVAALVQSQLMPETTAYARGQTWRTVDFSGEYTPFREGNSDIAGHFVMIRQQSLFTVAQEEAPLPTLTASALPLPPGAPANFANTVGHYELSATTTATSLAMNEAVEIELTVRGSGNLQQLKCPAPDDASAWKLVPATRKPLLNASGEVVGMTFSQLMRPTAEVGGIPSFSFSYFDPEAMEYKTASTRPIPLEWRKTESSGSGLLTTTAEPPPAGEVPVAEMTDIYGFLTQEEGGGSLNLPRWLWFLLYLPALLILLSLAVRGIRSRIAAGAAGRAREKELSALAHQEDGLTFLKGAGAFIESRIPAESLTPELRQILNRRDEEAFRPDATVQLTTEEKHTILRQLRRALLNRVTPLILLCLAALPGTQASAQSTQSDRSAQDVQSTDILDISIQAQKAYDARQYTKALEHLEKQRLMKGVDQAILLYNIGNCQYRLQQPGAAALSYARALQIDPGLAEARANLAFIQRKEGAILPTLTTEEKVFTFLNCSQLWVATVICTALLALCIALQLARRGLHKPWLHTGTALALLLCLLCAVDWVYYLTRRTPDFSSLPPTDIAYILTETTARSSADAEGASILRLPPSTPVHLLALRGSQAYIETATGIRGWIPAQSVRPLSEDGTPPRLPLSIRF